jgi:hypothetical protein
MLIERRRKIKYFEESGKKKKAAFAPLREQKPLSMIP